MGRFKYSGAGQYAVGNKGFIGRRAPPAAPSAALDLFITQDYLFSDVGGGNVGLRITSLMTAQQQTDWGNGVYAVANISVPNNPARGYWIVTGEGGGRAGVNAAPGFVIDVVPPNPTTLNLDASQVRFYGGGGFGGSNGFGGDGGDAIQIGFVPVSLDINITLQAGGFIGRIYGAGGGGDGHGAGRHGGGGAAGYSSGTSTGLINPGGVYDPVNGGTSDVNVAGGLGSSGGFNGGAMGVDGSGGVFPGGVAGLAVNRQGAAGVTVVTGTDPLYVRGFVQ